MIEKLQKQMEGWWYYPVTDFVYDESYIKKYEGYAVTEMGRLLLEERLKILSPYSKVLDVGVGSGEIVYHKPFTKGFDVNPSMIKQLKNNNEWLDPYVDDIGELDAISFFDSFEHIDKPQDLLIRISTQALVIAMPIYKNREDLLNSKHFRPDEHFHYFTFAGFLEYMSLYGFECQSISDIECRLGRESIYTFVFKKKQKETK